MPIALIFPGTLGSKALPRCLSLKINNLGVHVWNVAKNLTFDLGNTHAIDLGDFSKAWATLSTDIRLRA